MRPLLNKNKIIVIRFDTGDDLLALFAEYCKKNTITAACFSALGAAGEVMLSYYNLETKQYEDHRFTEDIEILNLTGNVTIMDDKYIVHCHGMFGRKDYSTIGGHVKKLIVSATCEVLLTQLEGTLERVYDDKTGLNLLK